MTTRMLALYSRDDEQRPRAASEIMVGLWPGAEIALHDGLGHRLIVRESAVIERVMAFLEDFD